MEDFVSKRLKWFIKDDDRKKKGKRGTPKKATIKKPIQRQLVDEPSEVEAQNEEHNVETSAAGTSTVEVAQEIENIVFVVTKNVEEKIQTGDVNVGENVEGTVENVKGAESSSPSDIELTHISPTTGDPMAKWRKQKEKRLRKERIVMRKTLRMNHRVQRCQRRRKGE
ncbi:hypothetical protein Hanom_Chr05g00424931 [Helianthus anomalus]